MLLDCLIANMDRQYNRDTDASIVIYRYVMCHEMVVSCHEMTVSCLDMTVSCLDTNKKAP